MKARSNIRGFDGSIPNTTLQHKIIISSFQLMRSRNGILLPELCCTNKPTMNCQFLAS